MNINNLGFQGIPGHADRAQSQNKAQSQKTLDMKQQIKGVELRKTEDTKKTGYVDAEPSLSDAAKEYLEKLRSTYTDISFTVADFSTDEEADNIMAQQKTDKKYTALIDPDTLEKMAKDSEVAAQFESVLSGAGATFDKIEEELGDSAKDVERLGLSIDGEGNIRYTATMRNDASVLFERMQENSEKQREELEKSRNDQRKPGRVTLYAESIEELREKILEQIEANKRENLQTEQEKMVGQKFDFKI